MQLNFFETAVSLLFIFHIEYFDQFECDHTFVRDSLGFKNIGELSLTNQFLNFEAIDHHANVQHDVVAGIRDIWVIFLRGHLWFEA